MRLITMKPTTSIQAEYVRFFFHLHFASANPSYTLRIGVDISTKQSVVRTSGKSHTWETSNVLHQNSRSFSTPGVKYLRMTQKYHRQIVTNLTPTWISLSGKCLICKMVHPWSLMEREIPFGNHHFWFHFKLLGGKSSPFNPLKRIASCFPMIVAYHKDIRVQNWTNLTPHETTLIPS